MNDLTIFERGGKVLVNSRDVALKTGKQHGHILRDIDNLLKDSLNPNLDSGCWFIEEAYLDVQGRECRSVNMTKDGFTLLAMGWTGPKWVEAKINWILQFNRMEAELARIDLQGDPHKLVDLLMDNNRILAEQLETMRLAIASSAPVYSTAAQLVKDVKYGGNKWQKFRKSGIAKLSSILVNRIGDVSKPGGLHGPWEFPRHLALRIALVEVPKLAKEWKANNNPTPVRSAKVLPLLDWSPKK